MPKQDKKMAIWQVSFVLIMIFAAIVIWPGCKKQPDEQIQPEQYPNKPTQSQPTAEGPGKPAKSSTNITTSSQTTLNDIIRAARGWGPAHQFWYGKHAPDFTLTDTTGKQHKLSDYHGKNVMIIFWATWCPPCRMEIPHLIELRKTISEDNLAMLAITNEKPELVIKFATNQKINYTILLEKDNMPKPFGFMRVYGTSGVPCSFFITPDGRIKLATAGLIPLNDIKAILQAESAY